MRKTTLFLLSLALASLSGSQILSLSAPVKPLPVFEKPIMESHALMDVMTVMSGMRRWGADLAFIQTLQYYGTQAGETKEDHHSHYEGDGHTEEEHVHFQSLGQENVADSNPQERLDLYDQLFTMCRRIVSLDPYFHYAYLFGGGALAFNLNRDDEALELLSMGIRRDPSFWQFRLYAGAIAFRKANETDKVIQLLEEAIQYPDCPTMLENILANLHKKTGNYKRAAEVFIHIIETSRDEGYVERAHAQLKKLTSHLGLPRSGGPLGQL